MADAHKKRQKQIRMADDVRQRFDAAQKRSGLTGEQFVEALLDSYEGKNAPSKREIIAFLEAELRD